MTKHNEIKIKIERVAIRTKTEFHVDADIPHLLSAGIHVV